MGKHGHVLGAMYVGVGLAGFLGAAIVLVTLVGGGFFLHGPVFASLSSAMAIMIALLILVFAGPSVVGGIAILQNHPASPTIALILGVLNLMNVPFGTPVGIYAIWAFLRQPTGRVAASA